MRLLASTALVVVVAAVGFAHPATAHDARGAAGESAAIARAVSRPEDGTRFTAPRPGSYALPVIKAAADGTVLGSDGAERRLFEVIGPRIALIAFVYTRCADEDGCPLAAFVLGEIEAAMEAEPALARALRLVSLSFDPVHDTPAVMAAFGGAEADADAPWAFLTTRSEGELRPLLDGYGQHVLEAPGEGGGEASAFNHLLKVFLVDRQRRVRNIYSASFLHAALVLSDVHTLMIEEARGGR